MNDSSQSRTSLAQRQDKDVSCERNDETSECRDIYRQDQHR
jgi:hypothetical protein